MNTEQPVPTRSPFWKRLLKWSMGFVLSIALLLLVAGFVLQSKIESIVINEINSHITVPVKVNGGITFSLIKHFPYASVTFKNVVIEDKLQPGKKLLSAEEFSMLFNLYSIFKPPLEFSKMDVRNGELNLYTNVQGNSNYDIFKKADDSAGSFAIQLRKAQLKNISFSIINRQQHFAANASVKRLLLSGNFSDSEYDVTSDAELLLKRLQINGDEIAQNKTLQADVVFNTNQQSKQYTFKSGHVMIEGNKFSISGFLKQLKKSSEINLTMQCEGQDIHSLLGLLPEKIRNNLSGAEGHGNYTVNATVKGLLSKTNAPKIEAELKLKDSELKLGAYNKLLQKVHATAQYSINEKGADKLTISNFSCTLNNLPFSFQLVLENLANPTFDFRANGTLHLEELNTIVPDSIVRDLGGTILFKNFHLQGKKADFTDAENATLTGSGEFVLNEVEAQQNGITYGNINGVLKYENKLIDATNFTLNFLSTDFSFTGTIENLFPYIYNLSEKRKANDVTLAVNGLVKTKTFNLSGILEAYDKKNRPNSTAKEKLNIREVFAMKGNLLVQMQHFIFRKMEFDDLYADLQLSEGIIRINGLQAKAMKGHVKTRGMVSFTKQDELVMNCDVTAVNMDVPTIFRQCENFGQTTLTDKNLNGSVSLNVSFNTTWKNYKEVDPASINALVDFTIKNGELINFEPIYKASKFINIDELQRIKFSQLSNTIRISEQRFDIPEFEIKSSALNLMLFGKHYFNNTIDYHFKINLHKVLAQKFNRKLRNDIEYMEADPYEGLNIYLSMTGPIDNPDIKYDKASTRKKIQEDFKKEKDVLKNLLQNRPEPSNPEEKIREEKYFDVKETPQFIDFEEPK